MVKIKPSGSNYCTTHRGWLYRVYSNLAFNSYDSSTAQNSQKRIISE